MSEQPLWSERQGGALPLTKDGFVTLLRGALNKARGAGFFEGTFGFTRYRDLSFGKHGRYDPEEFFTFRLGEPWGARVIADLDWLSMRGEDQMLDLIEVLYREGIMAPVGDGMPADSYEQAPAQLQFREWVNPVLARRDPPLELNESGVIEEQVAEPFRRLIEQPLPQEAPKREVTDRVADAISHFKRRGATIGDRRAAARELADVLEFLRKDVQVHMLKKDEGDLYRLANDFALRHNKPETRRDFEEAVWLSWTFYVYLATIRLVLELKRRSAAVSS